MTEEEIKDLERRIEAKKAPIDGDPGFIGPLQLRTFKWVQAGRPNRRRRRQ